MKVLKFDELFEQMGSGDMPACSCGKKKKKKKGGMKSAMKPILKSSKWSSDMMSEGKLDEKCGECGKSMKKKKMKFLKKDKQGISRIFEK